MSHNNALSSQTTLLLHSLYHHDQEYMKAHQNAIRILLRDPYLIKTNFFDISDRDNRKLTMRQIRRVFQIRNQLLKSDIEKNAFMNVLNLYDRSLHMRLYVHFILFSETLWSQGSDEINQRFQEKIQRGEVLGCFGMTELGFSSFLRGMKTVAKFNVENDEFVLTTECLLGTKWWIGMAGQVATHAVILARLQNHEGKEFGLHWFLVPLRDPETGQLLPGVTAGHLGAKAGRGGLDNGWIQFSNCCIPRENLLQRFIRVERDGTVTKTNSNPALSYMTLIGERIVSMRAAFNMLSQAITISVRYGLLRRQGSSNQRIIDYQSHYFNLMPVVGGAYALQYMHNTIIAAWKKTQEEFIPTNRTNSPEFSQEIQYYHAMSAGCKSFLCWWVADALEVCRRSGGGHFYSAYNAVASIIGDYAVITTGGGDNTVLAQQCSRYLLGQFKKATLDGGKGLHPALGYLGAQHEKQPAGSISMENLSLEHLLEAFQWLSYELLSRGAAVISSAQKEDKKNSRDMVWNDNLMQMIHCSEPHIYYATLLCLKEYADEECNRDVRTQIRDMGVCWGLSLMERLLDRFLECEYIAPAQVKEIRKARVQSSKKLRNQCEVLVDGFGIPDEILKAPLAAKDSSKAYETYFAHVKQNSYIAPYWEEEVKPLVWKQSRM